MNSWNANSQNDSAERQVERSTIGLDLLAISRDLFHSALEPELFSRRVENRCGLVNVVKECVELLQSACAIVERPRKVLPMAPDVACSLQVRFYIVLVERLLHRLEDLLEAGHIVEEASERCIYCANVITKLSQEHRYVDGDLYERKHAGGNGQWICHCASWSSGVLKV
ncbi:hypothetical protein BDW02DRAFT_417126 [Decorospora gaudefroyi]|uniref:Uncharacterized protein n=1 Tax=Decorospora gaudefroyi TaxID=184978 RepID=A0A6A5K7R1_9PLEO|nr:hypothetical protein BDW02DRAFT_417126 [Decorospora gaudefroyi]